MIQIDDKIVSIDVIEKRFSCDLSKCKGACCVVGDSGAPIEIDEVVKIEDALDNIFKYLNEESINNINQNGVAIVDSDGDLVTPLNKNLECAFSYNENGLTLCAIERAWKENESEIQKPVSCHLYPIRLKQYRTFTAVNFHSWEICKPAIECAKDNGPRIYEFNKDALIRKFGEKWYDELTIAANYILNKSNEN